MSDERPIIIIKKKGGHEGHHGGSWKVAYADFVTAMMAFFLVMWILGLNQETRKSIAAYFNNPEGFMKSGAGGRSPMSVAKDSVKDKPAVMPAKASILKEHEGQRFKEAKKAIENALNNSPELHGLKEHVEVNLTPEGLRIELIDNNRIDNKPLFFDSGSANLRPETEKLLRVIGPTLAKLLNRLTIEGHTDAHPYSGRTAGYTNWELSSDRANTVRRAMTGLLRQGQIARVAGYADSRPRSADPFDFSNRRVSFLLEYSHEATGTTGEADPARFPVDIRPARPNFTPPKGTELEQNRTH